MDLQYATHGLGSRDCMGSRRHSLAAPARGRAPTTPADTTCAAISQEHHVRCIGFGSPIAHMMSTARGTRRHKQPAAHLVLSLELEANIAAVRDLYDVGILAACACQGAVRFSRVAEQCRGSQQACTFVASP